MNALPPDCATALALKETETGNDHAIHEGVVTAAHCFDWVAAGGKRDILIREEAVRNGRFGVLSVFSLLELPHNGRRP